MSKLRSLAGQTAIYGVSSILGRLLNYALVPLHTAIFTDTGDLGIVNVLYSYTAIFMVIYTMGMETAFFRFASHDRLSGTFNITTTTVLAVSTLFTTIVIVAAPDLALAIGYPDTSTLIIWLAIILWIDSVLAIPFAKLRLENKARIFAAIKMINIVVNVALQVVFLFAIPFIIKNNWPTSNLLRLVYDEHLGIGYIVLSNLIASALLIPMLWKWISTIKLEFDWTRLKPLLVYALPIVVTGIGGMFNEHLDKILLENLLPDNFYPQMDSTDAVGVYTQTFKLSIFMMLAIQAFRYAGEPFFFGQAKDKKAPELFARVMHYFTLISLLLFVLVSINVELIGYIFLRNPDYRVALYLVPILLLGKLFYGIYMNLSIWFKLADKTRYGMYFTIAGATLTIAGNVLLIPVLGYTGSALTSVCCYAGMTILCYAYGQKHYPIPYQFLKLVPYFIAAVAVVLASFYLSWGNFWIDSSIRIVVSIIIVALLYQLERPHLIKK